MCIRDRVSASRTDWITRPRGEGLGLVEVSPSKSFLPRFFTKKRAGSRGGALGRAPQRAEYPIAKEAQEGVKGGTLAGGSPFAGGLSRPQPARFTNARSHPTPGGDGTLPLRGGGRNVAGPAVDEGKGRRGRRPLRVCGRPSVCRGIRRAETVTPGGGGTPPGVCRPSTSAIQTQNDALRAAFSPFPRRGAPKFKSVRGADTLAVGHGRQRRVGEAGGAGTSVRRDQPKAFFFGAPPRFFGQDQRNGVEQAAPT